MPALPHYYYRDPSESVDRIRADAEKEKRKKKSRNDRLTDEEKRQIPKSWLAKWGV